VKIFFLKGKSQSFFDFLVQIIFYLVAFTTLYLQINQIFLRAKLGYGLTDEAFGLSYAIERGKNGQGNTALFADITSIPLTLTEFNIKYFRLIGLFIIILLGIHLIYSHLIRNQVSTWRQKIPLALFVVSVLLTIPMNFRYLLITPSYQWIVMVFSILAVSLTFMIAQHQSKETLTYLILSLSIFLVTLSRPTSGLMLWLLVNSYFFWTFRPRKLWRLIRLNLITLSLFICYLVFNWQAVKASVERYLFLKDVDPYGSNLFNESIDVLVSLLFVWSIFILGHSFSKFTRKQQLTSRLPKVDVLAIAFMIVSSISIIRVTFAYPDSLHFFLMVLVFLMGSSNYFYGNQKFELPKMLLSSAPILTQFGSNTSASYLISPFLLSVMLYTLFDSKETHEQGARISLLKKSVFRNVSTAAITSLVLIISILHMNLSYETHLPLSELKKDPISSLYYSPSKIENIQKFRLGAGVTGEFMGEKILDLSFMHPGVILYLGGLQFPFALENKVFRSTLSLQVEATIKQVINLDSKEFPSIIVETDKIEASKRCLELSEYVEDAELKTLLRNYDFNPRMFSESIYISDPVDLTLYPRNVLYLVPCSAF
jgi:hypothetical protein